MRAQIPENALRRLRQPENRAQIHQQASGREGEEEGAFGGEIGAEKWGALQGEEKGEEEGEEDCEGEGLEDEAGEEDVVGDCGAFLVGLGAADHACAGDLQNRCDDIAGHKAPEYQLWS